MANFRNYGFETGTIGGWTRGGGTWDGGVAPDPVDYLPGGALYQIMGSDVAVTNAGFDGLTNNNLRTVYDGEHSVRVNSPTAGQGVSVLSQEITGYTGSRISFAFAAVLQDSHVTGEADGFAVMLTDFTTGEILYNASFDSATAAATFTRSSSGWYYRDWQSVTIDTASRSGHDFAVTVIAYDCALSGHAGYLYLDGFVLSVGSVAGNIYRDFDRNAAHDPNEPALAGWTVYADDNGNGLLDQGEVSAVADAQGNYVLNAVETGTATIRVDVPIGVWEGWAAPGLTVTVTEDAVTSGVDIGVTGGATPLDDVLTGVGDVGERISGLAGNDLISAGGGNDIVSGGFDDDILRGGFGTDIVEGGRGDDRVVGNDGDDFLFGEQGDDRLSGRLGADIFAFSIGFGQDRIRDFDAAEGDKIQFDIAGIDGIEDLVFTQDGLNTIITLLSGGGDEIFVRDVLPSELTAADFVFGPVTLPVFAADATLLVL